MQRGARITLAAAILLAGATAAMMFRRDKPAGESAPAASGEPSPSASHASGTSAPRPVTPHLVGRIEFSDHASDHPTGPLALPPAPLTVLPAAALLLGRDKAFADDHLADSPDASKTHRIRDGDTLSELARRYLGRRERFMEIFEANRDKLTTPDLLPIGKELRIPSADQDSSLQANSAGPEATLSPTTLSPTTQSPEFSDPAFASPPPPALPGVMRTTNGPTHPPRIYRVQNEETLVQVAERVYGSAERYRDLYEANRDRLDSAQNLRPGMLLVVP
jgi:nucleoid-associated protein YgaU